MKTSLFSLLLAAVTLVPPLAIAHHTGDHQAETVQLGKLELSNAYLRATPPRAPVAGGYLTITNSGTEDDRLLSLTAPVGDEASIHEMAENDGVMTMRPLQNGLTIPAGETVTLEPGGLHLMLTGLKEQLVEGQSLDLTLNFEKAGAVTMTFEIRALNARGKDDHAAHGTKAEGH